MIRQLTYLFAIVSILLFTVACNTTGSPEPDFIHNLTAEKLPWTGEDFAPGSDAFTFGIISDLNGGERPGVFSRAVEQLNLLDPDFVLSVGDLIDGGTEDTLILKEQWASFDTRAQKLNMPFFYLGGNHDLSNIRMREYWEKHYGPRYYHFKYKNALFLILDSEDYTEERFQEMFVARDSALKILNGTIPGNYENSTYYKMPERSYGAMGATQQEYFTKVLQDNPNVSWTFVLMHKPLWLREGNRGLGPLEEVLNGRKYTVINGHFHRMSYQNRQGMDYLMLGTTGGSQTPGDSAVFDHISLVRMKDKPVITHLKMDGILITDGSLPLAIDP
jgi:predicted phosphodiesterase